MLRKLYRGGSTLNKTPWKLNKGTGTNQIATEEEAKSIGNSSAVVEIYRCCTKAKAIELGCSVTGTYSDSQLVKYSDLVAKFYTLTVNVTRVDGWIVVTRTNSTPTAPLLSDNLFTGSSRSWYAGQGLSAWQPETGVQFYAFPGTNLSIFTYYRSSWSLYNHFTLEAADQTIEQSLNPIL